MKRMLPVLVTLVALATPTLTNAQPAYPDDYSNGPLPYNDVEDGQALKFASYVLSPLGFALEWGMMRPLHYTATDTPLEPVLSGDTDVRYFGESSNADRLPPGTFAPFRMPANPNAMEPDNTPAPTYSEQNVAPSVPSSSLPRRAAASGGQPALH